MALIQKTKINIFSSLHQHSETDVSRYLGRPFQIISLPGSRVDNRVNRHLSSHVFTWCESDFPHGQVRKTRYSLRRVMFFLCLLYIYMGFFYQQSNQKQLFKPYKCGFKAKILYDTVLQERRSEPSAKSDTCKQRTPCPVRLMCSLKHQSIH